MRIGRPSFPALPRVIHVGHDAVISGMYAFMTRPHVLHSVIPLALLLPKGRTQKKALKSFRLSIFDGLILFLRRSTQIKTYSWDNAQVVLAGNKCDMDEERVVSVDSGRLLAEQLGKL